MIGVERRSIEIDQGLYLPKLGPPPFKDQKRSVLAVAFALTTDPSASTTYPFV